MTDSVSDEQAAARRDLQVKGRRRTALLAKLAAVEAEVEDAIVVADRVKVPRLTIADDSGMVRATVYNVLERKGVHTREVQT